MIHKILSNSALMALVVCLALVLASVLVLNYVFTPTMERVEWEEEAYIVKVGDTLWAIAGSYCPGNVDRREWVDEVQALNGMTGSTIHPGQTLTVLAVKEG